MTTIADTMRESAVTPQSSFYWSISLLFLKWEIRRLIEREEFESKSWSI